MRNSDKHHSREPNQPLVVCRSATLRVVMRIIILTFVRFCAGKNVQGMGTHIHILGGASHAMQQSPLYLRPQHT